MYRPLAATALMTMSLAMACGGASSAQAAGEPAPVYTRARLASFAEEPGGKLYVRLKLMPRSKIPFTTQTFRVRDRTLVAGLQEGATVKFTTRPIDGENALTAIRAVAECKRFQPCD